MASDQARGGAFRSSSNYVDPGLEANPAVSQKAGHFNGEPAFEIRVVGWIEDDPQTSCLVWTKSNRWLSHDDARASGLEARDGERFGLRVPNRKRRLGRISRADDAQHDWIRTGRE
jgi:hypothetical protein